MDEQLNNGFPVQETTEVNQTETSYRTVTTEANSTYTNETSAYANGNQTYQNQGAAYTQPNHVYIKKKTKKEHKFAKKIFSAVAVGLVFGIFAGAGFYAVNFVAGDKINKAAYTELEDEFEVLQKKYNSLMNVAEQSGIRTVTVETDITKVVEKVMPSMVSVSNTVEETYRDFFGRTYKQEGESSGSGIIIGENDTDYFIATNQHVIDGTVALSVQFVDGSTSEAYVKGYDSDIDIAVIAVKKENLSTDTKAAITVAEIGDSDSLKMGEPAIAIGNALGYGQSVTTGVISALDRTLEDLNSNQRLIQTSAAINPGNSGGALLNIEGEVIGINSSKIGGDTVEGMGFAIPINDVIDIIGELSNRETKDVVSEEFRGYLGIQGLSDESYAQAVETMGYPEGAYVVSVYEGSPAEAAGIFKGDVITKCDGQTVKSLSELQEVLSYYRGGDEVTLSILRITEGEFSSYEVTVTLGDKNIFN